MRAPVPNWPSPLDVVQDEEHHACLTGLPLPPADITTPDGQQAQSAVEYVANEMVKRMRLVWRKP